jgi:oligopeptide/dipeptide ABC transporter ATP-binding protein
MSEPLLSVRNLTKQFALKGGLFSRHINSVHAIDGVDFHVDRGETLGLVGESGCGKSTTGRCVLRLIEPSGGEIHFDGKDVRSLGADELRILRRDIQIIFQDPYASLNPRMNVGAIVGEALIIHQLTKTKQQFEERVVDLLETVGLRADHMGRYPNEFSGGQRQRIGIARALALNPELIIGDEPVSALDVSIQAQILNLLMELQDELKLSYLFVAHDLAVVEHISDRVAVMYLGRIVEITDKTSLFETPLHPYTEALLSAVPIPKYSARNRKRVILKGDVPSPINPPSGCHFHARCPYAMVRCRSDVPELREVMPGHWAACHLHDGAVRFPLSQPAGMAAAD